MLKWPFTTASADRFTVVKYVIIVIIIIIIVIIIIIIIIIQIGKERNRTKTTHHNSTREGKKATWL